MDAPRPGRGSPALFGRLPEQAALRAALGRARGGRGGVVLVAGEAGVGKTCLVEGVLRAEGLAVRRGPSRETRASAPLAPVAALLRAGRAASPEVFVGVPLVAHLALLLPELGPAPPEDERTPAALHEALRGALRALAGGPVALVLEDLHWADHATLDLLPALAEWLADRPALVIGTFRREALPRAHPLRRARLELRRLGHLEEIVLGPLGLAETAELAAATLGAPVAPALAAALYERTGGVPLFVEELAAALRSGGGLAPGEGGHLDLAPGAPVEVPPTLQDAVGALLGGLPPEVRAAAETASVLGLTGDANLLLDLLGDERAFDALTECGLLAEEGGSVSFRHALIRDAVYAGLPWGRRRRLHRQVAAGLEAAHAPPWATAEHWLAGREPERARAALLAACEASCRLHASRDAAQAARRALDLWPPGAEEERRLGVLGTLGRCAQACGQLAEAARAWREAAGAHREAGDTRGFAEAQRRLAGALDLQGRWEEALEARRVAADAFGACGLPGPAAEERLAVGSALRSASCPGAALGVLAQALGDARQAGRRDLEARILGQEGNARARLGQVERGLAAGREALAMALAGDFTGAAVELLHRLADSLEQGGDYAGARAAYEQAVALCGADRQAAAFACRACLAVPLYQNGDWDRAVSECRAVLGAAASSAGTRAVAGAMLGTVLAHRGQPARARPVLLEALVLGGQTGLVPVRLRALWGLALAEEAAGRPEGAATRARELLELWEGAEDHYHVLFALRWASSLFAGLGDAHSLRHAADALGRAADLNGGPVAYSALAHALGELAWFEGRPEPASRQFEVAARLLADGDTPFEEASTRLRAGQVRAALGEREGAAAHLRAAARSARALNAVTLARHAARALEALGEGGAFAGAALPGLTRRQLEVLRLVALGRTDKAIARELRLSPRTVEMHVGRLLASLDSHTRAEAVGKAAELGLLTPGAG